MELLIELYNCFEAEDEGTGKEVREALYYYVHDYMEDFKLARAREKQDPTWSFAVDIIMESDLSDLRSLKGTGRQTAQLRINSRQQPAVFLTKPFHRISGIAVAVPVMLRKNILIQRKIDPLQFL